MYKLALFLLLACSLHAQDDVRLTAEAEPLTTICGCVNAISGDFFFSQTDIAMHGSEPLHYTMLYDSGLNFIGAKGYGIGSQYPFYMNYAIQKAKTNIVTINVMEREGFHVPYKGKINNGWASFTVDPTLFASGFTNYSEE
ncbi:MAG: DUF6531 domain-containing protein, partial [Chlamydiales bacterium]|nr:DUF6531 domain-containing protein [Chlamydiales bacterium]